MLRRCVICVVLLTLVQVSYGQQQWPNTFLWKITGKGLSKPSYLYGTIHLQDKRLFRFPDSLYNYMETAEGFALEIDFNEFIDSMFNHGLREAENKIYSSSPDYSVDRKKLDKSTDSLLKKFGVKPDKISKKDLKKIRDYRINKMVQKGEMPTIVDGFLYGIAQRQGKILTGIEDVADQLNLVDELGADLTPEQVFQPESKLNLSLQFMIDMYLERDLQKLTEMFKLTDQEFRDQFLINRNIKMARRMDSLSAIRSTVFAVGVAHLPGDSGVITLLRNKGFTVEPVFSQNFPDATVYMDKLESLPWKTIDEKFYQVKMPGRPSAFKLLGEIVDMRAFFDLPTMTMYLTGTTIGQIDGTAGYEKMFNNMARNMNGRKNSIKPKYLMVNGMKAGEAEIEIPQGTYRVRLLQKNNVVFMQMAGSSKASNVHSTEVNRFFDSFTGKDIAPEQNEWTRFSIPGKGFSISLPGTPKPNKSIDRQAEGSVYNFTSYDYADPGKGVYYLVQVRDAKAGYFIEGDTTYYSATKTDISTRFDKIISDTFYYHKGWPASKMKVYLKSADATYSLFNLVRGNRIYCILVGWPNQSGFSGDDDVINSLELEEYKSIPFTRESAGGFYTKAPAPFVKMENDSTEEDSFGKEHFISYDPNSAISFEVFKEAESKYYWAKNDSAYYAAMVARFKDDTDSTLGVKTVWNGGLKGLEATIRKEGSTTVKKIRGFVNRDTLYYIFAEIPLKYSDDPQYLAFFDEFRLAKEQQPSIYKNKAKELFEALSKSDSIERTGLLITLNKVSFEKSDLPVLHKAILEDYPQYEGEYYTINYRISQEIEDFADTSTVRFISDHYPTLKSNKEAIKYPLLYLLASVTTKESYSLLKKLIVTDLPRKGNDYRLVYKLKDSLELTRLLFPDILKHSKDTEFVDVIVPLARTLIDSNHLSLHDLAPYQNDLLNEARRRLAIMKANPESWKLDYDWTQFLGIINNNESNALLTGMLAVEQNELRYRAVLPLVKNNQPVPASVMEKLAADNSYRLYLYEELKKLGKLQFFPAKYATRQKIGESEIYNYASEDDEEVTIKFIGERTAEFLGKKEKFLLYKATFSDEEGSSYLGVIGPCPSTGKEIITDGKASGIYWEQEFDKNKLDEFLTAFLKSMEEYQREQEDDDR